MLVCDWLHLVGQNHFYVMMLFNRDSVIFRVFLFRVILLEDSAQIPSKSNRIPCNRPDDVIFRPDAQLSKLHSSGRRELSVWTFLCVEMLRTAPGCILLNVSANTSGRLSMFDKSKDVFPKHKYGKIAAIVQTMCVPVRKLSLIRQVVHIKFNHLDVSLHGSDAQALIWK
jgi:hypothetical protein